MDEKKRMNYKHEAQSADAQLGEEIQKKNVIALKKEYRFAADCLKAVLQDSSIRWQPRVFPLHMEPFLCSANIISAIHQLVSIEITQSIDIVFESWFDETNLSFPRFKLLLDMLATNYCDSPVTPRKFLEFCCTVAEISAIMYVGGFHSAPDYGILCIFYCTMHSIGGTPNPKFFQDLEIVAHNINVNHERDKEGTYDPLNMMSKHRTRVLSGFRVRCPA